MPAKVDVKALTLEHLNLPPTEDLKTEVQAAVEPAKPAAPENDPRHQKEYTFEFKWADGRDRVWEGTFTNHVLSVKERSMVGVMRARLSGGQPYDALDPLTQEINLMISHMTFSLAEKDRSGWAKDLREIENLQLLQALYGEVVKHESTFFGW
jgi:hypothetical protein